MTETRQPIHRRTIEIEAFEEGDFLHVTCRLRDTRPYSGRVVHDLSLSLGVDQTLTVTSAEATMAAHPHVECTEILPKFDELVGLSVARGYTRAVQERFIGVKGCSHLEFMARAMGPAIVQAMATTRAKQREAALQSGEESVFTVNPFMPNSCHIWAEGGAAEQKIAAGWRPGVDGYPAPNAVEVRRRRAN